MTERFLTAKTLASLLCTTQTKAAAIMEEQGVYPIDLGVGKYNRLRWLESAVHAAMQEMHRAAQPTAQKTKRRVIRRPAPTASLSSLSIADIHRLTSAHNVQ